jgi:signal transduction histidine kinase
MPPFLRATARVLADPANRSGIASVAALLYELCVLAVFGAQEALVTAPVALAVGFAPRRPVVGLACTVVALVVPILRVWRWPDTSWVPMPVYLALLVPITAGALSTRRPVRTAAAVIAAAAVFLAVFQAATTGMLSARPALAVSAVVLLGAPFAAAWALQRPEVRAAVAGFVRPLVPDLRDRPPAFWWTVAAAAAVYAAVSLLDLASGEFGGLLATAPLIASLLWVRSRPDLALALCGTGVLLVGLVAPFSDRFGSGTTIAILAVIPVVFCAVAEGGRSLQRAAAALVVAGAVVGGVLISSGIAFLLLLLLGALPFGAALLWRRTRTVGHLRVRLRESENRGRRAERTVQAEQERIRIAREVHDVVAHSLAVVIAQADGARYAAEARPTSVGPALEAIAETARTALGEVRTMLHDLRSTGPDVGAPGPDEIPALLATVRSLGVEVEQADFGVRHPMSEPAGLAMFRIVQEALTNALRHGDHATPIALDVDWGEQEVVVVVTNGLPADPGRISTSIGHGIAGMHERAGLVGGECTAGAGSNGTFRVRASLPVLPLPVEEPDVADAFERLLRVGTAGA